MKYVLSCYVMCVTFHVICVSCYVFILHKYAYVVLCHRPKQVTQQEWLDAAG